MELAELERQSQEILTRAIEAVAEILTPLEDSPDDYLAAINRISDYMIINAKKSVTSKMTPKEDTTEDSVPAQPVIESVRIPISQFEREYAENPILARRKYTGKKLQVSATMDEFEQYLENGAESSSSGSPEEKYKYKNVSLIIPGEVFYINEINKDGMIYDVRFKGTTAEGRNWEILSLLPKEAGKQVMSIKKGQIVKIMGHYGSRDDNNRYSFQNCEFVDVEPKKGWKKNSLRLWGIVAAVIAAGIYILLKISGK